ncbi:hypothetical protein [Allomuricauda sp. M10]|uniref:hypothetical protein n=1 Tax=Allomuricauda sp. M10 TaxID=2683292 RepID=UPI001D17F4E4|nr:hypothetical protein [Muricauda sp. M10]
MGTFLITYDLHAPIQNYQPLIDEIKKIGTWWHCLESVWIIKSNYTCAQLRDILLNYIDNDDELLVVGLTGHWASSNLSKNCSDWLKQNM